MKNLKIQERINQLESNGYASKEDSRYKLIQRLKEELKEELKETGEKMKEYTHTEWSKKDLITAEVLASFILIVIISFLVGFTIGVYWF